MAYWVLFVSVSVLVFELARFDVAPEHGGTGAPPDAVVAPITFIIPLAALEDVLELDHRPEIADVIRAARASSDSAIFIAAYVTADDVWKRPADAADVSAELAIEMSGYLASQGVEPGRISGKGMGIDSAIGRAVVVSFGITARPSELGGILHVARKGVQALHVVA